MDKELQIIETMYLYDSNLVGIAEHCAGLSVTEGLVIWGITNYSFSKFTGLTKQNTYCFDCNCLTSTFYPKGTREIIVDSAIWVKGYKSNQWFPSSLNHKINI